MTIPLNTAQKQLVETSMDLVPQMIRSMTRTSAYVSEEEQQELCQIGYLALCRRLPALIRTDLSCRMPEPLSATPSLTTGGKLPVTAPCCVLFRKLRVEGESLSYQELFSYEDAQASQPETDTAQTLLLEHISRLGTGQCSTIQKGIASLWLQRRAIPVLTLQGTIKYQPIVYGHGRAKHGNYYSRMMHSMHF